jgi:hypothetical protein
VEWTSIGLVYGNKEEACLLDRISKSVPSIAWLFIFLSSAGGTTSTFISLACRIVVVLISLVSKFHHQMKQRKTEEVGNRQGSRLKTI